MDLKEVFESRRSVNFFDPGKTVSRELLQKIYDLARLAPSSYNLQPWKFIEVSDPGLKSRLRDAAHGQEKIERAALTLIILADTQGYDSAPDIADDMVNKGYIEPVKKNFLVGMQRQQYSGAAGLGFALRNAGLFAMSFMLAAKYYGVDTHPMDGFDADRVREAFAIPDRYEVAMLIAVGYHDERKPLLPRLGRKDFSTVCVEETFSQPAPVV